MTTTVTHPAPLARLAVAVRKLHAAGWAYDPQRGEYRRGEYTLEPEILSDWVSVALSRESGSGPRWARARVTVARLGWAPADVDVSALPDLIAGLS